jgi:thioesterase domain-containing protein
MQEGGFDKLWSTLVPMQQNGSKPPLFCITPWDGNTIYFRSLPKYLNRDQPIYGLEPLDQHGGIKEFESIDHMIDQYIKDINSFYPSGSLSLCGFSGGGVIALEIARRLKKEGRDVRGLYLFDTACPGYKWTQFNGHSQAELRKLRIQAHINAIRQQNGWNRISYVIESIGLKLRYHLRRPTQEETEALEQENAMMMKNLTQFRRYSATPYHGEVVLFKAKERRLETILDPTMGWSEHTSNEVRVIEVPGGHNTMLLNPNDQVLCLKLQEQLDSKR